jgi:Protein of unknown function (DUF2917)
MQQEAAMLAVVDAGEISLRARGVHRIEDGAGSLIECLSGVLWITQNGDHRDITLERGQRFWLDRDGLAIVYGLEAARFRIAQTGAARAA